MCEFKVGEKVVDIGNKHIAPSEKVYVTSDYFYKMTEIGKVYVINKIIRFPSQNKFGLSFLGGYTSFHIPSSTECGFDSQRYRKLEEIQSKNQNKQIDLISKNYETSNPS